MLNGLFVLIMFEFKLFSMPSRIKKTDIHYLTTKNGKITHVVLGIKRYLHLLEICKDLEEMAAFRKNDTITWEKARKKIVNKK